MYGHSSQHVCPWNVKFAGPSREPAFAAREMFVDTDARTLAREILMMQPADYTDEFKGSSMKRAKLWMLKRNATVVLGTVGTEEELPALEAIRDDEHEVVREHAALARIGAGTSLANGR